MSITGELLEISEAQHRIHGVSMSQASFSKNIMPLHYWTLKILGIASNMMTMLRALQRGCRITSIEQISMQKGLLFIIWCFLLSVVIIFIIVLVWYAIIIANDPQ